MTECRWGYVHVTTCQWHFLYVWTIGAPEPSEHSRHAGLEGCCVCCMHAHVLDCVACMPQRHLVHKPSASAILSCYVESQMRFRGCTGMYYTVLSTWHTVLPKTS